MRFEWVSTRFWVSFYFKSTWREFFRFRPSSLIWFNASCCSSSFVISMRWWGFFISYLIKRKTRWHLILSIHFNGTLFLFSSSNHRLLLFWNEKKKYSTRENEKKTKVLFNFEFPNSRRRKSIIKMRQMMIRDFVGLGWMCRWLELSNRTRKATLRRKKNETFLLKG